MRFFGFSTTIDILPVAALGSVLTTRVAIAIILLTCVAPKSFSYSMASSSSSSSIIGQTSSSRGKTATLRILLHGGDNMLGRAVQLSFPTQSPGEENIVDSCTAAHYLNLALQHGDEDSFVDIINIRRRNAHGGEYLWSNSWEVMQNLNPKADLRILNLETAITRTIDNPDVPLWKGIRYHLHVDNFDTAMRGFLFLGQGCSSQRGPLPSPLIVSCANNHAMDYGRKAFEEETLPAIERLKLQHQNPQSSFSLFQTVGCGANFAQAAQPARAQITPITRVVDDDDDDDETGSGASQTPKMVEVYGFSTACSGTPSSWWATSDAAGLMGLPSLHSMAQVDEAIKIAQTVLGKSPDANDRPIRIVSIHWGPNWAMQHETKEELTARRAFAHRLIDTCQVDLIYGHSSHHARGMELYKGKLILYGTGDIVNDYEGFENRGEEKYNRLGAIYVVDLEASTGHLRELRLVPMYMNRLRLERYTKDNSEIWKPQERRTKHLPNLSEDLRDFLNGLSKFDAGSAEAALLLEHCDDDPQIPGGPVLVAKV